MPVWQLGLQIVQEVYKLTNGLPKTEDYASSGQLRDAAISIPGNIAEGFGRAHTKDKMNFYYYSRGSAFEVLSHLYCGEGVHYFTAAQIQPVCSKCEQVIASLNKIIKGLSYPLPKP